MNLRTETRGGLTCRIVESTPAQPNLLVVLCHGFGAPGTDLVPLAGELCAICPNLAEYVRFVFPEAPLTLDELGMPGGRAWWPLDMDRLTAAIEQGEFRDLRNDRPEGLPESRRMLTSLIGQLQDESGLATSRVVLGGFSQGSMLATDVALRLSQAPAALCLFSSTLLNETEWRDLAARRGRLKVLQSHGTVDPILPYQAAEWLRDLLTEAGMDVDFISFYGLHSIPKEGIEKLASLLDGLGASTVDEG